MRHAMWFLEMSKHTVNGHHPYRGFILLPNSLVAARNEEPEGK